MEHFQQSGETVHRYEDYLIDRLVTNLPTQTCMYLTKCCSCYRHFHCVLDVLCSLAAKYIVLPQTLSEILASNPKYASQYDNCRLAFDGTHVAAFLPEADAMPFRDRTGRLSQNVFAACTFDILFAFVVSGCLYTIVFVSLANIVCLQAELLILRY